MAQPISLEVMPRDPRKELARRLEEAPLEHAEGLLDLFEVVDQLHKRGIFYILSAALGAGDELVEKATGALDTPDAMRAIRNIVAVGKILASIDPEVLRCLAAAVDETVGPEKRPRVQEPPGLISLVAEFRQPEIRRSMALVAGFLQALGTQLRNREVNGRAAS